MTIIYIIAGIVIGLAVLHEICRWFYDLGYDNGWEDHVDRVLDAQDKAEAQRLSRDG